MLKPNTRAWELEYLEVHEGVGVFVLLKFYQVYKNPLIRYSESVEIIWTGKLINDFENNRSVIIQVNLLNALYFYKSTVLQNDKNSSLEEYFLMIRLQYLFKFCEQTWRQSGRPHDLTCKPTACFCTCAVTFTRVQPLSSLLGLRKKNDKSASRADGKAASRTT